MFKDFFKKEKNKKAELEDQSGITINRAKPIPIPIYTDEIPDLNGFSVLVVEDNIQILKNLAAYITKYGAVAECADNGQEGLETFCQDPDAYDLIIMDLQMPIMDGREALQKIRTSGLKKAKTIPIILMSGSDGFDHYIETEHVYKLRKPFQLSEVVQIIYSIKHNKN